MSKALRALAVCVAVAAVIDPAFARRVQAPVSIELSLPKPSDPTFARAVALRDDVLSRLGSDVAVDSGNDAHAVLAIGNAVVSATTPVPVYVLPLAPRGVELAIRELRLPEHLAMGQRADVLVTLEAVGLQGRTATVTVQQDGVILATQAHPIGGRDETLSVSVPTMPLAPGVQRLRITARAPAAPEAVADAALVVHDRQLRVLVYEPRPSWPATFVRRSLEADALFHVSAVTRSSHRTGTLLGSDLDFPLENRDLTPFDAIVVGAPDALAEREVTALLEFVRKRGGRLVVLSDRMLPDRLRQRLGLPELYEVLLDKPLDVELAGLKFRASELLVPASREHLRPITFATLGGTSRAVIAEITHDAGSVIFSGALDAWRFRGAENTSDVPWRSLIADAAAAAPPPVSLVLGPGIARPGEAVDVTVSIRATEFAQVDNTTRVPAVSASLTDAHGNREMIRLWPAARTGVFHGTIKAPVPGRFTITAAAGTNSTDAVLMVADDVVHPQKSMMAALAFTAQATGGGVVETIPELHRRFETLQPGTMEKPVYPMRSPWWFLPFAAALGIEWALRRRAGLR